MANKKVWFKFEPTKECILLIGLMLVCWITNYIADMFLGTSLFYVFYQGLFAIGCCITVPLYIMSIKKQHCNNNVNQLIGIYIDNFHTK